MPERKASTPHADDVWDRLIDLVAKLIAKKHLQHSAAVKGEEPQDTPELRSTKTSSDEIEPSA